MGGGGKDDGAGDSAASAVFLQDKYVARVFDRALSGEVFALAQTEAEKLAECPNYWVPRERVDGKAAGTPLVGLGEIASADLYDRVLRGLLEPGFGESWGGCEYWTQVYRGGRGLEFHYDKDESKVKSQGVYEFPIFSCVIYLTDGSAGGDDGTTGVPKQSPTIVVDQIHASSGSGPSSEAGDAGDAAPRRTLLSYPKANRVLVFDGRLAHGVLDSTQISCRKTLLVNFWKDKPEALGLVSAQVLVRYGLRESIAEDRAPASGGESGNALTREDEDGSGSRSGEEVGSGRGGSLGDLPEERAPMRHTFEDEDDLVLVDDLAASTLEVFRKTLCLSVSHPSHALYPIEATRGMDPCTLGAFVRDD